MGEIELSAADDEDLVFGDAPDLEKSESERRKFDSKKNDLPTTFVPSHSENSIAVAQGDDFLDELELETPAQGNQISAKGASTSTQAPSMAAQNVSRAVDLSVEDKSSQITHEQTAVTATPKKEEESESSSAVGGLKGTSPTPDTPVLSVSLKNTVNVPPTPMASQAVSSQGALDKSVDPLREKDASQSLSATDSVGQPREVKERGQPEASAHGVGVRQNSNVLVSSERRSVSTSVEVKAKREAVELFEILLGSAVKGGASDLLLKQGQVPMFRWNGELFPSRNGPRIDGRFFVNLSAALLSETNCQRLNNMSDIDFSYQSARGGRVRVNIFHQRGDLSLVARLIPSEIPTFEKLEMGKNVRSLVEQKRGLILVTGATGSGKSTTLAAMLDFINSTRTSHIITIEDPIEFVHSDKRSLFNQRELGLDTPNYAQALKSALRQAPDVILVGELRDSETVEVALQAAETGHLVLSTLHTNDAADSLLRILGMCGLDKEAVVRAQLADCLRGVVSQRLIKRHDKTGRVAAQEIMISTANIREKLLKGGHPSLVRDVIAQGGHSGMQSFDQHLAQLVQNGVVDYEEALRNATNRDDFALRYSGVGDGREAS